MIAWRRLVDIPAGLERAWLYGVAYRVLGLLRAEEQRLLSAAYRRLRPDDQEVLRLAAWEELPHEQIGIALGCETGAARQRLHRARARLAHEVERAEGRTLAVGRRRDHA